jgi:hypothetical protein
VGDGGHDHVALSKLVVLGRLRRTLRCAKVHNSNSVA